MTEDEDAMDELEMLESLAGRGSSPEPTPEIVDRHRHELRAAMRAGGAAGPAAVEVPAGGDIDLREPAGTVIEIDGAPGVARPVRWRSTRALAAVAAGVLLIGGVALLQRETGGTDRTVAAGEPANGDTGTGPAGDGTSPLTCGDELPVDVMVPDGFSGPTSGPGSDAATAPQAGQHVVHWASESGTIEVRWPADHDTRSPWGFVKDDDGYRAGSGGMVTSVAELTRTSNGRMAKDSVAWLGEPASERCQAVQVTVAAADTATVDAVSEHVNNHLFDRYLPALVIGSSTAERAPEVDECRAPSNIPTPPNKGSTIKGAATYPMAATALEVFLETQGTPGHPTGASRLSRRGYQEITLPDGSIAYAYESSEGFLSTVIEVDEIDGGWAVAGWEASGC